MIIVNNLSISFGKKKVLNNLHFHVQQGEIFGFLGPSGAGKTTTIKILTNQLIPTKGSIQVNASTSQIGILSDNSGVYERLTVWRNLQFFAELHNSQENVEQILKKVKLWDDKDKKVKDLSKGMHQRLLLACAIVHKPKLLFLDEPTASLDPATVEAIHDLLLELKNEGTTIFLTTHNMEEASRLCDHIAFLNKGKIVELATILELKLKYALDKVRITFNDNTTLEVAKDKKELIKALQKTKASIISIHSIEPTLADIFLQLTGRNLK